MRQFVHSSVIPAPPEEVFAWHERPGAFERLAPPWQDVEVLERSGGIQDGDRVALRVGKGPLARWLVEHRDYEAGRAFHDVQLEGPFKEWRHAHRFSPHDGETCLLEDRIDYAPPLGGIGEALGGGYIEDSLRRVFTYRHDVTARDIEAHRRHGKTLRVAVTGSSGLVGAALCPYLTAGGHEVLRLRRGARADAPGEAAWDPLGGSVDTAPFSGFDAVVHLAGEPIIGRWSADKKQRIRRSRVEGTATLVRALCQMDAPPKTVVCASAMGYYGDTGEEVADEDAPPGDSFVAEVCREWEAAAAPLREKGIRVAFMRLGMVLSPRGGALATMLPAFRAGAGSRLGDGRQWTSWIALDDVVGGVHHLLARDDLEGPFNFVAPGPVRNADFTRVLAGVLRRPALGPPVPAVAMRAVFGEMADELLLNSARLEPRRLREGGYDFAYPELAGALRHLLGRTSADER